MFVYRSRRRSRICFHSVDNLRSSRASRHREGKKKEGKMVRKRKRHPVQKGSTKDNAFPFFSQLLLSLSPRLFRACTFTINSDISSRGKIPRGRSHANATYSHFDNGNDAAAVTTDCNEIFDCWRTSSGVHAFPRPFLHTWSAKRDTLIFAQSINSRRKEYF